MMHMHGGSILGKEYITGEEWRSVKCGAGARARGEGGEHVQGQAETGIAVLLLSILCFPSPPFLLFGSFCYLAAFRVCNIALHLQHAIHRAPTPRDQTQRPEACTWRISGRAITTPDTTRPASPPVAVNERPPSVARASDHTLLKPHRDHNAREAICMRRAPPL